MLHRRTTVALAATAALVLAGAAPVLAQETENFEDFKGNATTCSGGQNSADLDGGVLIEGQNGDSDSTDDISGDVTNGKFLNVTLHNEDVEISGIVIKAGSEGYRIYDAPEPDMTAPPTGKQQNIPAISHWFVCGEVPEDDTPPPDDEDENGEDENGEDENGKEKEGKEEDDEKPEVPTEVPAGHEGSSGGISAGTIGLIAAATALLAGAAALVRRRFVNGS